MEDLQKDLHVSVLCPCKLNVKLLWQGVKFRTSRASLLLMHALANFTIAPPVWLTSMRYSTSTCEQKRFESTVQPMSESPLTWMDACIFGKATNTTLTYPWLCHASERTYQNIMLKLGIRLRLNERGLRDYAHCSELSQEPCQHKLTESFSILHMFYFSSWNFVSWSNIFFHCSLVLYCTSVCTEYSIFLSKGKPPVLF